MIELLVLEERHVELIGEQRGANMLGQRGMALYRRQITLSASLIGHAVLAVDAKGERRVVVEEERRHVVVEDHEQRVGFLFGQPFLGRCEPFEHRRPHRVVLFAAIYREADRGRVRAGNATDNASHLLSFPVTRCVGSVS